MVSIQILDRARKPGERKERFVSDTLCAIGKYGRGTDHNNFHVEVVTREQHAEDKKRVTRGACGRCSCAADLATF